MMASVKKHKMLGDIPDFSGILETVLHDPLKMGLLVN